jgi:hypothetical protein
LVTSPPANNVPVTKAAVTKVNNLLIG